MDVRMEKVSYEGLAMCSEQYQILTYNTTLNLKA